MANESRGNILKFITGNIVPVAVVLAVFLLFVPIPKFLIDLSMILNLALSIIILLVVVRTPRPSDFQSFPRVILFPDTLQSGYQYFFYKTYSDRKNPGWNSFKSK